MEGGASAVGQESQARVPGQRFPMNDPGQVPNGLAFVPHLYLGISTKPASRFVVRLREGYVPRLLLLGGSPRD